MDTPKTLALQALRCLDLTALADDLDRDVILTLCARAMDRRGPVAAVCVPARWVTLARDRLAGSRVRVASVANFPGGRTDVAAVVREVQDIGAAGAREVDVVLPYRLVGVDAARLRGFLAAVRDAAGPMVLKVILESGVLKGPERIREAADEAIGAGADFIKTSTGRAAVHATPAAAAVMLAAIRDAGGTCGFKASGGISSLDDAATYIELASSALGPGWVSPQHFRLGASSLLDALLEALSAPDG